MPRRLFCVHLSVVACFLVFSCRTMPPNNTNQNQNQKAKHEDAKLSGATSTADVPPPTGFSVVANSPTQLTASWTSGGGSTAGFFVAYAPGTATPVCSNGARLGLVDHVTRSDFSPGETISISVCAVDADDKISTQVTATRTTPLPNGTPPPAPTGISVTADSSSQLTTRWTSGGGSTAGFYLAYVPGTKPPTCTSGPQIGLKTSATRSDFNPGQTISVSVCAYDASGNVSSPISATQTTTIPNGTPPPAPTGLTVTADSPNQLTARWTSGGGTTTGFYVAYVPGTTPPACANAVKYGPATSRVRSDFRPDQTISISVCAYDDAGNISSAISATQTTQTPSGTPPPAPTNLTISADSPNQLTSSWTSGGGTTTGFYISYVPGTVAPTCTNGVQIGGGRTSVTRSDFGPAQTISISVCAYDASGNVSTQISATQTTKVPTGTPPPAPTGLSIVATSPTQLTTSWTSGGGTTAGFYLAYVPGVTPPLCTNGAQIGSRTSVIRSDFSPNQVISISVCAYDAAGNVSPAISGTQTVTVVSDPVNLISDPSFQTPALASGSYRYNPTGSAWTFSSSSGLTANNSGFTSKNPGAPVGDQVAFIQGNGSIRQSVSFTAGTYQLMFYSAQRDNNRQTIAISVDGTVIGTVAPSSSSYSLYTSPSFQVTQGNHAITLTGTNPNGGDNTAFVDQVTTLFYSTSVSGTVTNASGSPLSAASISINGITYAQSGSDGKYSLTQTVPVGPITVCVRRDGYQSQCTTRTVSSQSRIFSANFSLAVAPVNVTVDITVQRINPDLTTAQNIDLYLMEDVGKCRSNITIFGYIGSGTFTCSLFPGSYTLVGTPGGTFSFDVPQGVNSKEYSTYFTVF